MANTTPTTRQVNIYVNQASAEAAYDKLDKKAKALQETIDKGKTSTQDFTKELEKVDNITSKVDKLKQKAAELTTKIDEGKTAGKAMTKEMESLAATNTRIGVLSDKATALHQAIEKGKNSGSAMVKELAQLTDITAKMDNLRKQIDTGMTPAMKQVQIYASELNKELYQMSADAPGYAAKFKAYQEAQAQLAGMKNELKGINAALQEEPPEEKKGILGWLQKYKDEVKTVAIGTIIGNTTQAIFEKVTGYFSGIISGNAKLSDSFADISKATGMTDDQVKKLNSSLGKIDTRTKTADLREMAIGLGQIGEAVTPEAIANIDKIVVALGDEFGGGAKEITTELGVLRNNLQDIKTGDYGEDVLHIGNALNVLGADGLATAPVVTDIAKRISGVGETFGLTAGQILGTAATFQELGIESERGSSAYTKILQNMTTNTSAFAKVAGMDVQSFTDLVNTDITSALLKVAEGAKNAGKNNVAFGEVLKTLDADGSGAGEMLAKLASNSDLLTKKIKLASGALLETGSITDEFNKKNGDLAAQVEKLNKTFDKLVSSPLISGFLVGLVSMTTTAVKWVGNLSDWITKSTVAFLAYVAAGLLQTGMLLKLKDALALAIAGTTEMTAATLATTIAERAQIVVTSALGVVKAILTLNIKRLRQEWLLMSAAMNVNPWALAIALAATAYLAYRNLTDQTNKLTKAQEDQKRLQESITSNSAKELGEMEALKAKVAQVALGMDARTNAAKKLQQLYPEIFGNLKTEQILAGNVADAYARATKAIIAKASSSVFEGELGKVTAELVNLDNEITRIAQKKKIELFKAPTINGAASGYQFDPSLGITADLYSKIQKYNTLISTQTELVNNLKKAENDINPPDPNAGKFETLETLKKKLQEYQGLREKIDINDKVKLAENLKLIQDVQAKIDAIDYKKSDAKAAENEADRLAKIQEKIKALRGDLEAAAADYSNNKDDKQYELEVQKVRDKYAKLILEAKKYAAEMAQLSELEKQELDQLFQKQFDERSAKEYDESLQNLSNYYNQQKQIAGNAYASNTITKEEYSAKLHQLDTDEAQDRVQIANDYKDNVKKAADAAEQFKTNATTKGVADRKNADELEAADRIAALQRNIAVSPAGSVQQLNARKALLQAQNDVEIQALKDRYAQQGIVIDKNNEQVQAKQAELNGQLNQLDTQYMQEKIQKIESIANQVSQGFASILNTFSQNDQVSLQNDQKANDKKKTQYQAMLDNKQISQAQYNKMVAQLDSQLDKKQQDLNKKKAARDKATAIFSAVISTAAAVAGQLAMKPVGPWNIALAAVMGALGAVQIATIAAQKTPTYATGRRPIGNGGIADGPSHADGGIQLVNNKTGQVVGEMEGDEAIISKSAVRNNPEIANALLDSSMNKGGERINPLIYAMPSPINTGKISQAVSYNRMYANGGWVSSATSQQSSGGSTSGNYDSDMVAAMNSFTAGLKNGVKANLVWTELMEMQRQYTQVSKGGSMGVNS